MSAFQDNYVNPFDDDQYPFLVLVNAREQYSLWPEFAAIPSGWDVRFGPAQRNDCLEYIEIHWLSINPFQSVG